MLPEKIQKSVIEEIELFIQYGVGESELKTARELVSRYSNNAVALAVLGEFYRVLPEAREEAVIRIGYIGAKQGVTILVLSTHRHSYLSVVSENAALILGEYGKEELPADILAYLGYADNAMFLKKCLPVEELEELNTELEQVICPACQVAAGDLHILGCPVEICPWCDGQLSNCNCRFEKLELTQLENEEQLKEFQRLLEEEGRVPYGVDQKPAYPGTSAGLDSKKVPD